MKKFTLLTLVLLLFIAGLSGCNKDDVATYSLTFDFDHQFNGEALTFNAANFTNEAGNAMSFTTLKYLISEVKLHRTDGTTDTYDEVFAYINPNENRTTFTIDSVLNGSFEGISFTIGLDSTINHSNPNVYAADHALNPSVNQMHWDWSGGYIFLSMEGQFEDAAANMQGFSYHIAFLENRMPFDFMDSPFTLEANKRAKLVFNVEEAFKNPSVFDINDMGSFSHSSWDNGIANTIRDNMASAIKIVAYE